MFDSLDPVHVLIGLALGVPALYSAGHALLHKQEPNSALVWLVTCLTWPPLGPLSYWIFGRNRIRTKGRKLQGRFPRGAVDLLEHHNIPDAAASLPGNFPELLHVSEIVTGRPLLHGNRITPLACAEEAYPRMLGAIRSAKHSICLLSYIFDNDTIGKEFAGELSDATKRGVDVKVLIDGIGEYYTIPRISSLLGKKGVSARRFLPPSLLPPSLHINLRNHRKLLTIDDDLAFTGGMNISDRHYVNPPRKRKAVVDLHFAVEGPIVSQMKEVFLEDWCFVTGDINSAPDPGKIEPAGTSICRAISDGPNEDIDKLKWIILGAVSAARKSIRIMTPYFLPGAELTSALNSASLRGVDVEIILPGSVNLPPVGWAARNYVAMLLPFGTRVYHSPGPFVHTKLLLIDEHYVLIGSANLDPRSLRLNFEFNLEFYGEECVKPLSDHFCAARDRARPITEQELRDRSLPVRLRDSLSFLCSPYL